MESLQRSSHSPQLISWAKLVVQCIDILIPTGMLNAFDASTVDDSRVGLG